MTLGDWVELADALSSLATVIALIVGGVWSYLLFVRNRERYPRAALSQTVEHFRLTSEIRVMRIAVRVENTGKVLLSVAKMECRLLQVLPVAGSLATRLHDPATLIEEGRQRIAWPMVHRHVWTFEGSLAELEPGESEILRCDFVVENDIKLVQVYSHLENDVKKSIGWSCLTQVDIGA